MRKSDKIQLLFVILAIGFVVIAAVHAQSQEAINATTFERISNITQRLDRIDNYLTGTIAALIANLIAHGINIKGQREQRQRRFDRLTSESDD